MEFSLKGKVTVITGGSRGIGETAALEFGKMGATVVISSRKLPDLEKVAGEIEKAGGKAYAIAAHLGNMEDVKNLISEIKRKTGRIDILINNAGASPAMVPLLDVEERLFDAIMNPNLKGLFFLSQAVARIMKEQNGGSIINVASVDAFKPEENAGIYSISKSAVVAATKAMALEWGRYNIRVNAVAPGQVHTRLGDSRFSIIPGYEQELIRRTPIGRIAGTDEIIGALIYLASDASSFVTGSTFVLDGGFILT